MDMNTQLTDEEIGQIIDNAILNKSRQVFMSTADKLMLRQELFNSIRRLDLLQELIDDPDITEVMVNGPDSIFYESLYGIGKAVLDGTYRRRTRTRYGERKKKSNEEAL